MKMEIFQKDCNAGIGEHFRQYAHALRFAIGLHRGAKQGGGVGESHPPPP